MPSTSAVNSYLPSCSDVGIQLVSRPSGKLSAVIFPPCHVSSMAHLAKSYPESKALIQKWGLESAEVLTELIEAFWPNGLSKKSCPSHENKVIDQSDFDSFLPQLEKISTIKGPFKALRIIPLRTSRDTDGFQKEREVVCTCDQDDRHSQGLAIDVASTNQGNEKTPPLTYHLLRMRRSLDSE